MCNLLYTFKNKFYQEKPFFKKKSQYTITNFIFRKDNCKPLPALQNMDIVSEKWTSF